jgi:trigger factor
MQVTETSAEGLKRELTIVLDAAEIDQRMNERLVDISKTIRMKGFRPGHVPAALVRKIHGEAILGEILEKAVDETSRSALEERKLRPALQPKVEVKEFGEGKGLQYSMIVEVLPEVKVGDLSKIKIERPVADVKDEEVTDFLGKLAEGQKNFEATAKTKKAANGDAVLIDFSGSVDGEKFEGGTAENFTLELGSGHFIPGFEDQLVGTKAGDKVDVNVTFPEQYQAPALAGKPALFEVTVKEVKVAKPVEIDDAFAERLGLKNLDELKDRAREQIERELKQFTRLRVKRNLLDVLAGEYTFDVPPGMVELEFQQIWHEFEHELEHEGRTIADEEESEEELRAEYRDIAERRVRLGLVLSEIGQSNNVQIKAEELNQAMIQEARRYPGQEQAVLKYFRENPQALAQLRAPIYEDKVVDFILEMAQVTEKKVSREELEADPDEAPAPAEKKAAKKPAAKKTAEKKAEATEEAPKKPAAKKAAPKAAKEEPAEKKAAAKDEKPAAKKPAAKKSAAKKAE